MSQPRLLTARTRSQTRNAPVFLIFAQCFSTFYADALRREIHQTGDAYLLQQRRLAVIGLSCFSVPFRWWPSQTQSDLPETSIPLLNYTMQCIAEGRTYDLPLQHLPGRRKLILHLMDEQLKAKVINRNVMLQLSLMFVCLIFPISILLLVIHWLSTVLF